MRNIFSLLGNNNYEQVEEIDISLIISSPFQTRKNFNDIKELSESISKYGLLNPIILQEQKEGKYDLIAGERRLCAMKYLIMKKAPAIVRNIEIEKHMFLTIIENLQRNNLNPVEEARAYKLILEKKQYTHEQLANELGKSRSHISNILRINNLTEEEQQKLLQENLTFNQIRNILSQKVNPNTNLNLDKMSSKSNDVLKHLSKIFSSKKITSISKNNNHKITFEFQNLNNKNKFIDILKGLASIEA